MDTPVIVNFACKPFIVEHFSSLKVLDSLVLFIQLQ